MYFLNKKLPGAVTAAGSTSHKFILLREGERWVSNPRPTEPQSVALTN